MHQFREVPYKLMNKYPGMRPRDEVIWDQYVMQNPDTFIKVIYDLHLGDPVQIEETRDSMMKTGMYDVARWCVDVIGISRGEIWAIEVKPNAGGGALGQALSYAAILTKEYGLTTPAKACVITDRVSPITQQAADLLGVKVIGVQDN